MIDLIKDILKNAIKVIVILSILIGLGYLYYQYKLEKYYQLSSENEKFIREEVWAKDSDGKGYSDKGQMQMNVDLKGLNNPKAWNLYKALLRQTRKRSVSKNKEDYLENDKEYTKIQKCLLMEIPNEHQLTYYLTTHNTAENDEILDLNEFLFKKYTKGMTYDEIYNLINIDPSDEDCNRLSK